MAIFCIGATSSGCSCTPGTLGLERTGDCSVLSSDCNEEADASPSDAGDAGDASTSLPQDASFEIPDAPPADNTCAAITLQAERVIPNVFFVIDQSGSMNSYFDTHGTRWEVLENALLANPDGVMAPLEDHIRFGLGMYRNTRTISGCPDLLTIPTALNNRTTIETEYTTEGPGGDTPTGAAINAFVSMFDTVIANPEEPTLLILATDGEPDTCADGTDVAGGRSESIQAVTDAFEGTHAIKTFVISLGTGVAIEHLQAVANAGIGASASDPAPYWVANDTSGLVTALQAIVGDAISCQVELQGTINVNQACTGSVSLGGSPLVCDTDWQAVDATHIELLASACEQLQNGNDVLEATFPCSAIVW